MDGLLLELQRNDFFKCLKRVFKGKNKKIESRIGKSDTDFLTDIESFH